METRAKQVFAGIEFEPKYNPRIKAKPRRLTVNPTASNLQSIHQILEFLEAYFAPSFTSYGLTHELVRAADGQVVPRPALKPKFFFRGQTRAYPRLIPSLYQRFPDLNTKSLIPETALYRGDGSHSVIATNPHYDQSFDKAFAFSRIKCIEIGELLHETFTDFPREIDAPALCQHYGFPTPFMDFTEEIMVSAFFATHKYQSGDWIPCATGNGVLYMVDVNAARDDNQFFYEIGIQPLPRPFAQKGSLFFVPHDLNMLSLPYVQSFGFAHDEVAAREISKKVGGAKGIFPPDKFGDLVESHRDDTYLTQQAINLYLDDPPRPNRQEREQRLISALGDVEIR
jgi:FRG domain